MKVFIGFDIPAELRNALLRHLRDFEVAHPACRVEVFEQTTPAVSMDDVLREPALSVAQISEHQSGPSASPSERAIAALMANPDRPARAIAKEIGVSHQTVMRAKAALESATAPAVVQEQDRGPHGPRRGSRARP